MREYIILTGLFLMIIILAIRSNGLGKQIVKEAKDNIKRFWKVKNIQDEESQKLIEAQNLIRELTHNLSIGNERLQVAEMAIKWLLDNENVELVASDAKYEFIKKEDGKEAEY